MVRCLDYFSYHKGLQYFMAGGFSLLLAFQGHTTFERNDVVRSDVHLWLDNVRKAPGLSRPHINLGNHYAQAGMYDEALAAFTTAISLNYDTNLRQLGLAHYNLGLLYLNHYNDDGEALRQFVQALEKFPDYPSALSALARMKLRMGHGDEAYALIREKLEKFPHNGKLLQMYGFILLKKGDYTGAVDAAKRSLERDPKAIISLSIIGESYRHMGNNPLAILYWRDYLAQNTSDARAHLALIELYRSAGDKEALRKSVMQLMFMKGEKGLTALLEESAQNPRDSVYVFRPAELHRVIRSVVLAELE
jgi:tetratricopeptide (TPR) repeat protein